MIETGLAKLCGNLGCEVFVLLLKTLTGLETNKALDGKGYAVVFGYLLNILLNGFLILSLDISLIYQADLLQMLGETSLYQTGEDLVAEVLSLVAIARSLSA